MSISNFLSVIIVTYNSSDKIEKCLNSVFKELNRLNCKYEIIVVDNNSEDSTLKILRNIKGIRIVSNKKNLGFAKGVNQAVRISGCGTACSSK